ncbi:LPS assembly lipoprotein LptE [Solimicrobium silvestre]|uniref:LPS-assembly lipoprotein LptE n=1 Tax=Solimicrobium silvestre TaxID=2099400 RepID=A0A2S9H586_9BURK|nr:LPS assembly lipoprotein LptE [Solimicrobium silvestre]PRC95101.1 Rare lipoprotein B [Solimicrobium silvestre]
MMSFINRWWLVSAMLASVLLISACGFHLRGASEFPFKTIYVQGSETTPLGVSLRRNLKGQENTALVDNEKDADVVLDILSERPEKVILSLTVQGLVREYTLNSYLTFQVRNSDGKLFLPPTTIVLHRVISYNENVILSKAAEEAMLYKDMQGDLIQQVVRRLSVLKMD